MITATYEIEQGIFEKHPTSSFRDAALITLIQNTIG